ncbi:DUF2849 domain-containing protein [Leisingera daeponensis]|uniref:DUF2849 domain-containing protein n=1 Tax=Leisingera daeponensis TaxID=405746 RepID=A0ABS7N9Q0_9RHOB|nr:DUF2849 domain-containing protein [Leisingera daeponensis]MBY6054921.1 DUF2849 domain-containing protein [Leisingera daeponensis]MBY6137929.1 DUF2849 domain-containing protein [Leisingera daeponensis]
MARAFTPKVITANDLLEGDVIYFTADGSWTRNLSEAELITDEAEAQLRLIEAEKQNIKIVGAYLADAKAGPNGPEPTHFREEFRRTGPSNYFHGKQEAEANV